MIQFVDTAPSTMLEFDQMVQKISKEHVSNFRLILQSNAATLDAIEHDLRKRSKFLLNTQENIKGMMRKQNELTEHVAVLRACKKVIFSGRERKQVRE